ncbi:MAG: hypothetical protein IKQ48_04355 [Paludibacteraceae bacterium]|nr:hypothetical protein [Paludibacteraceae bacterium]
MSRTANIIWQVIGIVTALGLLGGAVAWGYAMRPSKEVCPGLTYRWEDSSRRYLSESELDSLLRKAEAYPVGKHIDLLTVYHIEEIVRSHPMVARAECYTTPKYEVRVDIRQRVPLMEVRTPIERYFIDTRHTVMPWREEIRDDVLVVTGAVGPQAATTTLVRFAEWLQDEEYWRERIASVHMRTPQNAVLVLRGEGQPQVVMGSMNDYKRKLRKLRTFLDNSEEAMQGKHYRELDIRFRGQVIGR